MALDERQRAYLKEMGIDVWERRGLPTAIAPTPSAAMEIAETPATALLLESAPQPTPMTTPTNDADHASRVARMDWDELAKTVSVCTRCGLSKGRLHTVFGVGSRQAQWMIIGEAPGAEEDKQGEPFVGRAGQLLNSMLEAIGLKREEVYICNILKCLRYNTPVQLADGSWERIGRLVRARYAGEVMSVDQNGRLVPRRVTG